MLTPRKFIAEALLDQLVTGIAKAGITIKLPTRIVRTIPNINTGDMPALLLWHPSEEGRQEHYAMEKWKLHFVAWLVFQADPSFNAPTPPDDVICDYLDAIDAALDGQKNGDLSGNKISLGGLVNNVWIDGIVQIDSTAINQTVVIEVPISVDSGSSGPNS